VSLRVSTPVILQCNILLTIQACIYIFSSKLLLITSQYFSPYLLNSLDATQHQPSSAYISIPNLCGLDLTTLRLHPHISRQQREAPRKRGNDNDWMTCRSATLGIGIRNIRVRRIQPTMNPCPTTRNLRSLEATRIKGQSQDTSGFRNRLVVRYFWHRGYENFSTIIKSFSVISNNVQR
jgi:hypothetical protein